MAIAPGTGNLEVTLGITAPSMAVYNPLGNFTAMAWHYAGPNGARRNLFVLGTDETPFGGSAYICVFLSTTGVLSLEIFDGISTVTHTGGTIAENTWFHWGYVRSSASLHRLYRALDTTPPAFNSTLDISQTVTDNVAPAGLFVFIPPSTRVTNFKIFRTAATVSVVSQERGTWQHVIGSQSFNLSPLRLPDDLYNYCGLVGGTAWSDPSNTTNAARTHFTNIGSRPVAYAEDPATLLPTECGTGILFPFDPAFSFNPVFGTFSDDWTLYQLNTADAFALPNPGVIQSVTLWMTTGAFTPGSGDLTRHGSVGTESGVSTTLGDGISINNVYTHQRHAWLAPAIVTKDPITQELWNTLEPAVARTRINTYYWGWVADWVSSSPRTLGVTELFLRIGYIWDGTLDCICAPRREYGGGFGYTACCGPTVEGGSGWSETCDGDGRGPDGVNGTDAENWAQ